MENKSFKHLKLQYEDIKQDLGGIVSNASDCKVGDFGCGWGYPTLSLMIALNASECIGIDRFTDDELQIAQSQIDALKELVPTSSSDTLTNELREKISRLVKQNRWPEFRQGDVLKSSTLPKNLDLAYCKLLLGNFHDDYFNNSPNGDVGVKLAITNILNCVKQDGQICFVEKTAKNYSEFLEQAALSLLSVRIIHRGEISIDKRKTESTRIGQYRIYHARKNGG